MAESSNSGASESEAGVCRDSKWSEEYDRLPLKQRLKLLFTRNSLPEMLPGVNSAVSLNSNSSEVLNHIVVKKEDDDYECPLPASFSGEEKVANLSSKQSQTGDLKDHVTEANQKMNDTDLEEKVNVMGTRSFQQPLLPKNVVSSEVTFSFKSPSGSSGNCRNSLSNVDLAALNVKTESPADIFDDFDLVPLVERQRILLSRQKMGLTNSSAKGNSRGMSRSIANVVQKNPKFVKERNRCASKEFPAARNQLAENQKNLESSSRQPHQGCPSSPLQHSREHNRSTSAGTMTTMNEKDTGSSLKKKFSGSDANVWKCPLSRNTTMLNPTIKTEPLEDNETIGDKTPVASLPSYQIVPVKYKYDMADDSDTDELDNMLLSERMKLFSKKVKVPSLEIKGTKWSSKMVPSGLDSQLIVSEAVKGLRSDRPRKRRKTATDSVETALDEDAPGLLRILIEKGVSVDDIKLYGQTESDVDLDDLSCDESFTELESVIAKIFSQRTSLIKLTSLRYGKGERASYCLACLFSLVEQARYLRFRKWPVEWGWSRDLQSFIFVFERHNRIVLERPEYGYATYFFELVDSLPIDWQIKRLVIAMKLTSCSRVTLIENKAIEVGEDLTEGEAKVLMDYGWIPNTGLGTMLNYCDRVVHDRKHERDTSEWRTKIGKLLADGYNGGTIVSADLPRKAVEYNFIQSPEVKLEVE